MVGTAKETQEKQDEKGEKDWVERKNTEEEVKTREEMTNSE